MAADLLSPEFVRELEALRRRLQLRARSGGAGEHTARRKGGSAEFEEHRQYAPGDDLRRVDWLAYARTGEPVLKQFRAEEDVVVRLLLDGSESLSFGNPSKFEVSRRLAAAIGYLAAKNGQRVQLLVARHAETGRPLDHVGTPKRGQAALSSLLRELGALETGGRVDLPATVERALAVGQRPGLLVVLSDFFDPGPLTQALSRARTRGHEVALVQVLAREEVEPDFEGDLDLMDAETNARVSVTMDGRAIDAYLAQLDGLVETLRSWSRRFGARYVRTLNDEPLEGAMRRFVSHEQD